MSSTMVTIVTAVTVAMLTLILQKAFSNILSGIMLLFSRPFKKGDKVYIKQGAYELASGHVMKIGLSHTKIKAYNRDVFILSNSLLENCTIVNSDYKSGVNHIEHIRLSLDSNIEKAIPIIMDTLIKSNDTNNTAANTNIVCKYDNSVVLIQYNVRTDDTDTSYKVCSDICRHLIRVFNTLDDIEIV